MKEKVDLATDKIDWLTRKQGSQLVMSLLLVIIIVMSVMLVKSEVSDNKRYQELEKKVNECAETQEQNLRLIIENSRLKSNTILIKALRNFSPNPEWLTDKKGIVVWFNQPYIDKYLTPRGLVAEDLLGTDGTYVFGEKLAKEFKANNQLVLEANKPMTFDEIIKTTKFPVTVGEYVFAIGGMEYVNYK